MGFVCYALYILTLTHFYEDKYVRLKKADAKKHSPNR